MYSFRFQYSYFDENCIYSFITITWFYKMYLTEIDTRKIPKRNASYVDYINIVVVKI